MHTSAPASSPPAAPQGPAAGRPAALVLDVAVVLLFAGLGRSTHSLDAAGILGTAWPFLTGLLLGWALWRVPRAPFAVWPGGVALWLTTVAVGMALRALVGEGTAPSFVLVTLGVLGAFLLLPRTLVQGIRAARSRRAA